MEQNITLGKHKIKPVFVAPMAAVSDCAFRTLCLRSGFKIAFTEMINVHALLKGSKITDYLLQKTPEEEIFAPQIFGQNPEKILKAAKILVEKYQADIIDINFGCPAKKIIEQGAGSALLKRPNKIREIIKKLKENIDVPITCKIRTGITKNSINALEISKIIEEAGADMLTIHARTQKQGYSGTADWEIIRNVVKETKIPIIGNGDIANTQDIDAIKTYTNCKGIMIGRAAKNNPYLLIKKNSNPFKEYLEIIREYELNINFSSIKMHLMSFSKGINQGPKIRNQIMRATKIEQLERLSLK